MSRKHDNKTTETRALAAARSAGVPIPVGEIPGEEPDFTFNGDALGVEVSELLRPAGSNHGIMPAAEESYYREILHMAQTEYYFDPNAKPAKIILYFADARGKRRDKQDMAQKLVEFVKANVHQARPIANFGVRQLPEGFGSLSIAAESGTWWTGEGGNITLTDIPEALDSIITSKNKLVPRYRRISRPVLRFGYCFTVRLPFREVCRFRTASTNGDLSLISTGSFGLPALKPVRRNSTSGDCRGSTQSLLKAVTTCQSTTIQ